MATIHINKTHTIDYDTVRQEVQHLADKLSEDLSADYEWDGDRLVFKRKGASGHIDISESEIDIEIRLGLVLTPLKGTIEKKIDDYLDEYLS